MELQATRASIEEYGLDLMAELIAALRMQGSNNLVDELQHEIREDVNIIESVISAPEEVYYASEGRQAGRFPPIADIEKWLEGNSMDIKLAYPIARKIASTGTKINASNFLDKFKTDSEHNEEVLKAYTQDVIKDIEKNFYGSSS